MTCARCGSGERYLGELCADCRAFLLGDADHDPRGPQPNEWPFREWGPLVDLRSPADLEWIKGVRN